MRLSPTQSNLLRVKSQLEIAEEGYELLDEKREVMMMELMDNIHGFREMGEELTEKLQRSYGFLEKAFVTIGRDNLGRYGSFQDKPDIRIRMHSVMGVPVPELLIDYPEKKLSASLESTDENFDKAFIGFIEILEIIVKWAAKEVLLWRLGSEINKTQKRVNALDNLFIPQYKQEIKHIEEALEEEEREEFFRRKRLKGKGV